MDTEKIVHDCEFCKKTKEDGIKLLRCTGCFLVSYCSKEHQRLHYPDHKEDCKLMRTLFSDQTCKDILGCNLYQWQQLFHAVLKGKNDEILQILHDAGAEAMELINLKCLPPKDFLILRLAASRKKVPVETLTLLLEHGADPNIRSGEEGGFALACVCVVGPIEKAKVLVEYGADVNMRLKNGTDNSALHIACFNGQEEIANLLVDHGADVNAVNVHGVSPLTFACHQSGNHNMVLVVYIITILLTQATP